jgi:hypothetical protein
MKPEKELQQDALVAEEVPTVYTDLNAVAIEAEQPCRTQSALPFLAPNGIFTAVDKSSVSVIIRGIKVEVIKFNLKVNTGANIIISPGNPPPNCSKDGVTFLPAQSVNVSSVAEPQYVKANQKVTNVILFFTRVNKAQPATLGIRVKFEENPLPGQFNPKRKAGTVSFP